MRIPISYLLKVNNSTNHNGNIFQKLDKKSLTFHKIDLARFPAIKLAYRVLEIGGLAPHIFNFIYCFGKLCLDSGHNLVPEPPDKIIGCSFIFFFKFYF